MAAAGRVGIATRPRGGDWLRDEMRTLRDESVDVLVSMLTRAEIEELNLTEEPDACRCAGIEYVNFPVRDRSVPSDDRAARDLAAALANRVIAGRSIAIHCRQGIGRSSLMAALLLAHTGIRIDEAWNLIEAARGCPVPDTAEQKSWSCRLVDARATSSQPGPPGRGFVI